MTQLLRVSEATIWKTVHAIREAGAGDREAAAFWLGRVDRLEVDMIVVPTGPEVELFPLALRISEQWMVRLANLCEKTGRIVLGAAHSHPGEAFFSYVDADGFFHAVDCVSVVLPAYGDTTWANARSDWALFVGLRDNEWRPGSWDDDIAMGETTADLVELA
ncbi:MAG: hypothetical protein QOJ81_1493 [Chloroflexota bacterium]|jgi:proteasome lid subunit RPN8/RPN11|nr:hypothetical protein [Chloroflexota bacterium]